ncbi:MAG: hypothetical protein R2741_00875 [Methanolobus sp.]
MDDVFYDMAEIKNEVGMLSAYSATNPSTRLSVSMPVKMGGGNIPVFGSENPAEDYLLMREASLTLVATTSGPDYNSDPVLLDLGSVSYTSSNNYFVDQRLVYENGALIVSQDEYSLMRLAPSMDLRRTGNNTNISIIVDAVDINGPARSISSSSIEEVYFRTNGTDSLYWDGVVFTDVTMTMETSYPSSWVTFFETLANDAGLEESAYSVSSNDTAVVFFIEGDTGEDIQLNVTKSIFDARLNILG